MSIGFQLLGHFQHEKNLPDMGVPQTKNKKENGSLGYKEGPVEDTNFYAARS